MTLVAAVLHHALTQPEAPALSKGERSLSYAELGHAVERTAGHLAQIGLRPGDRLGVCLRETIEHVVVLLAAGHMAATVVPIDWHVRPAERARIANGLAIRLMLVEPGAESLDSVPTMTLDAAWFEAVERATPLGAPLVDWHAPYVVSSTSGTTGAPKFMMSTHLQEYCSLIALLEPVVLSRCSRYLSTSPLCFGAGRRGLFAHLLRGDTVVLHPTMFSAHEYVELVKRHRIDVGFIVPTVVRQLIGLHQGGPPLLGRMAALTSGGAPLFGEEKKAALAKLTPGFYERYGTAATGGITTLRPRDIESRADSVGQPQLFMHAEIVDEDDRPLPPGAVGRLRLRGAALGTGIPGPDGAAAATEGFRDGWYYPGELATFDRQRFLFIKGRASEAIIRGGAKIFPAEVESVLHETNGVIEAAVFGQGAGDGEEAVIAYVVLDGPVSEADLRAACHRRMPAYRVPKEFVTIAQLPRNASGKVDKVALARLHREKTEPRS